MSLVNFFSAPFYGDTAYYGATAFGGTFIDIPIELDWYRTNTDNVYVFHWTFDSNFISPLLATLDYELQIDKVITFDSPDLRSWLSADVITYQNGNVNKGYSVEVYDRIESAVLTFYARVRIKNGLSFGDWSSVVEVKTVEDIVRDAADALLSSLADGHVYPVDEVNVPLENRTSNISKVYWGEGVEFDRLYLEKQLTIEDQLIRRCRDERLYDVFGSTFVFPKPSTMEFVDYRCILKDLREANFVGGTIAAVKLAARCFTGVDPTIRSFGELLGFITAGETAETFTIPGSPYEVTLSNLPRNVPTIAGYSFVLSGPPAVNQFTVNFSTGVITFNAANTGAVVNITYTAQSQIYTNLVADTNFSTSVPLVPAYTVTLPSLPINTPVITGFTFTNGVPAAGEFSVNFSTGILTFNAADAGAAVIITYTPLIPTPPVIYNRFEAGFGIRIILNNPGGFTLDLTVIESLIKQIVPAHVRFVLTVA